MTQIITVVNQKGGVAKTTTVMNLGAALGDQGKKVLLMDLDQQNTLSFALGFDIEDGTPCLGTFILDKAVGWDSVLHKDILPNVDIVPSGEALTGLEMHLFNVYERERKLGNRIAQYIGDYDYVLIDNPPALSLLTVNSMTAADWVLIPTTATRWAYKGLRNLTANVREVKEELNPSLQILGVLLTMYNKQLKAAKAIAEKMGPQLGDLLFTQRIPQTTKFEQATNEGQTILEHRPSGALAMLYREVAKEVIDRGEK